MLFNGIISIKHWVKGVSVLSVFMGKVCSVFYASAIGLSIFEIFMRYVFNSPTAWTNETIMTLCATAWMFSVGAVTQQNRHITVTVLELVVGKKNWQRLSKLSIVISLLAVAGLILACWAPMLSTLENIVRSGSSFNPATPTYLNTMIVIAAGFYFLQLLANLTNTHTEEVNDHETPATLKD